MPRPAPNQVRLLEFTSSPKLQQWLYQHQQQQLTLCTVLQRLQPWYHLQHFMADCGVVIPPPPSQLLDVSFNIVTLARDEPMWHDIRLWLFHNFWLQLQLLHYFLHNIFFIRHLLLTSQPVPQCSPCGQELLSPRPQPCLFHLLLHLCVDKDRPQLAGESPGQSLQQTRWLP